jgi:hypothetical protein
VTEYLAEAGGRAAFFQAGHDAEALAAHPGPVWRIERRRSFTRAVAVNAAAKSSPGLPFGVSDLGISLVVPEWQVLREQALDDEAEREREEAAAAKAKAAAEWPGIARVSEAAQHAHEQARRLRHDAAQAYRRLRADDGADPVAVAEQVHALLADAGAWESAASLAEEIGR